MVFGSIAGILTAMIIRKIYLRKKRERSRRKMGDSQSGVEEKSVTVDDDVVVVLKIQRYPMVFLPFSSNSMY